MPIAQSYTDKPRISHNDGVSEESYWHDGSRAASVDREGESTKNDGHTERQYAHDGRPYATEVFRQDRHDPMIRVESRTELMARIKREQRPQWRQGSREQSHDRHQQSIEAKPPKPALLPPANIDKGFDGRHKHEEHSLEPASGIERPRSALHTGDFRQRRDDGRLLDSPRPAQTRQQGNWLSTSPTTPWFTTSVVQAQSPFLQDLPPDHLHAPNVIATPIRHRAASQGSLLSSSFVSRPPTSPLAVQSNSNDFEASEEIVRVRKCSPDKSTRRRTFSPMSFGTTGPSSSLHATSTLYGFSPPFMNREKTYSYAAHQPSRSMSSTMNQQSLPDNYTPSRFRRPSTSECLLIQRAHLVGGYEESILRGRMSTLPSRPLDFVAQIGVLGKGKCKSSLRCPPHVTVPFPAVFYDYTHSLQKRNLVEEGPSPYVGLVDLENFLESPTWDTNARRRSPSPGSDTDSLIHDGDAGVTRESSAHKRRRRNLKQPPGGSYRIPQQGQLQIVIKNPNKTAVKLYLVPYDLSGMKSGQKTFIRQRSYSAGPIIDTPLDARFNLGTDRPEAALSTSDDPKNRPVLRYLIHLHFCCPSRGRFYLYKGIRVVFANRVPDGKERLRNEIQLPEPRYSNYKPDNDASARIDKYDDGGVVSHNSLGALPHSTILASTIEAVQGSESAIKAVMHPFKDKSASPFDFARKPFRYNLSRISSFDSGASNETVQPEGQGVSPKSIAVLPRSGQMSWSNSDPRPTSSDRGLGLSIPPGALYPIAGFDPSEAKTLTTRPLREGLLALQFRDWAGQARQDGD